MKDVNNKLLIVKMSDNTKLPDIGDMVLLPDLKRFGKVVDIIGNTQSPYAVVKPFRSNAALSNLVNTTLYLEKSRATLPRNKKRG